MQRNPSKTPADLALSSRFICLKPPSLGTHVANLLSAGFFIYLETADQIRSQRTLSQLRWLLARGFIPAEGTCSLLAGVCGCRISWGVYLGVCSRHSQTDRTLRVGRAALSVPASLPRLTWKEDFFLPGGKCFETKHEVGNTAGRWLLEEPGPGTAGCWCGGWRLLQGASLAAEAELWLPLQELIRIDLATIKSDPHQQGRKSVVHLKQLLLGKEY